MKTSERIADIVFAIVLGLIGGMLLVHMLAR
jgi:hypothetical protein